MSSLSPEPGPGGGLRERKKAKTRAAIQHEALRLFREQGYEATTIEQIAATVEIAPQRSSATSTQKRTSSCRTNTTR